MGLHGWEQLLLWYLLPCGVMAGVSVAYFLGSSDAPLAWRLLTSAHGAVGALLYTAALLIAANSARPQPDVAQTLAVLYLVPLALLFVSVCCYRGPKELHIFEVVNVPTLLVTAGIGLFLVGVRAI